jgi:hypothetical protein
MGYIHYCHDRFQVVGTGARGRGGTGAPGDSRRQSGTGPGGIAVAICEQAQKNVGGYKTMPMSQFSGLPLPGKKQYYLETIMIVLGMDIEGATFHVISCHSATGRVPSSVRISIVHWRFPHPENCSEWSEVDFDIIDQK